MERTFKINLGKESPGLLPGDIIRRIPDNTEYIILELGVAPETGNIWITVKGEEGGTSDTVIKLEFVLCRASKIKPWYHEVCETCSTPESCDLCQKMTDWSTKKFVYLKDKITFFDKKPETVCKLTFDDFFENEIVITTDQSNTYYMSDSDIKILERGLICYRPKISPDYFSHCKVCFEKRCNICFMNTLIKNGK